MKTILVHLQNCLTVTIFILAADVLAAPVIDNTATRVQTTLNPGLQHLGTLIPKNIHENQTSRWTLGCETLDREYANYDSYKECLTPLGIKHIRLQGG